MGLIDSRDPGKGIIEGRFITAVLNDQAQSIISDSRNEMRRRNFDNPKWMKNQIRASGNKLEYHTIAATRFTDMKTRIVRKGYSRGTKKVPPGKKRKKSNPVHNRIIWRHKKFIIRTLSFGFTDEVKESFRKLAQDEGLLPPV